MLQNSKNLHTSHINTNHMIKIRIISFIYLTLVFIWSAYDSPSFFNNVKYLTMFGYSTTWFYFALTIQDYIINQYYRQDKNKPKSENLKYLAEIFGQISFCLEFPITIVFWAVLFPQLISHDVSAQQIAINTNIHIGPFIAIVIQVAYNQFTFKPRRYSIVFAMGTLYLLLNLFYTIFVGKIYPPIDWISIFSYILVVAAWAMSFFCHWLGRKIHLKIKQKRLNKIRNESQPQLTTQNKLVQSLISQNQNENK